MEYTLIAVEGVGPVVFLFGLVVAIYLVLQYASRENAVDQHISTDEEIAPETLRKEHPEVKDASDPQTVEEARWAVDQIEDKASMLNDLIARAERAAERLEPVIDHAQHDETPTNDSNEKDPNLEEGSLDDLIAELESESDLWQIPDDFLMNLAVDLETDETSQEAATDYQEEMPEREVDVVIEDRLADLSPSLDNALQNEQSETRIASDELASAINALRELTEEARRFCEVDTDDATPVQEIEVDDKTLETRFRTIYEFADDGLTPSAIARRVGAPVGKIELILGLRGTR
jgi:hypothetical protein